MPGDDDYETDGDPFEDDGDQGEGSILDIYETTGRPDMDTFTPPLFWPAIPAADIVASWAALRAWVEALVVRYPHLDHHVIPPCWWRHPGHVEALQALRDHERSSFSTSAVPTAATDWQWRFALIEGRLREWTAHAGCAAAHRVMNAGIIEPNPRDWDEMLSLDRLDRSDREVNTAVPEPGGHR